MFQSWFGLTSPRGSTRTDSIREPEKEKERKTDSSRDYKEKVGGISGDGATTTPDPGADDGSQIRLINAQKLDLSSSFKQAIQTQSLMVDELRKERVMDIIRRDITIKQVFESALEGNSERACAQRYKPLYEAYKNIYKIHLFDERIAQAESHAPSPQGEYMTKEEAKATLKALNKELQDKLVVAESLDTLLGLQQDNPVERNKTQASLKILNDEILKLETKISEVTGYSYGVNKNQREIEFDLKWARDNLSNSEVSEELIKIQQKLRQRNEQKVLISGGKRHVLGQAEPQVVTWESKTERQLVELFGSVERANEIREMSKEGKERIVQRIVMQMEELSKQEKAIAYHFAFCTEILKRASDLQHMEDLISRLRGVAKRNKEQWTIEAQQKLEKEREAAEKRRSSSYAPIPTEDTAPAQEEEEPKSRSSSGRWSFAELVKEAKEAEQKSAPSPTPTPTPTITTTAAPAASPLAHLKLFLSPASRGSLYKIKEDESAIVRQMLQEEEEAFDQEQLRKRDESLPGAGETTKPQPPAEPTKTTPTTTPTGRQHATSLSIPIQGLPRVSPGESSDSASWEPPGGARGRRNRNKRKGGNKAGQAEEFHEVLKGSISEATFELLKAQESLLWQAETGKEGSGGSGGASPSSQPSSEKGENSMSVRLSKTARRRARRKRNKELVQKKMEEEMEREQLVARVMQMVEGTDLGEGVLVGGADAAARQPSRAPLGIGEEDKHLWDVTCSED